MQTSERREAIKLAKRKSRLKIKMSRDSKGLQDHGANRRGRDKYRQLSCKGTIVYVYAQIGLVL